MNVSLWTAINRLFFSCGAAAQRGPWPPHSWGFKITRKDASQSVGLLWTRDQCVTETSTWQHTTLNTDRHPCPRWDSNPQSQPASGLRPSLRPRGHWPRQIDIYNIYIYICAKCCPQFDGRLLSPDRRFVELRRTKFCSAIVFVPFLFLLNSLASESYLRIKITCM